MTRTSNKGRKRKPLKKPETNKINNRNLKKNNNTTNTKRKNKNNKPQKTLTLSNKDKQIPHHSDSDSSDSDVPASDKIVKLLEPYTKQQLIDLIIESAVNDASNSLFNRIRDTADRDVSHRKIFVYGLGWDTTKETLISAFESCGEIEDCNVVTDRVTGKAKGFGFVLFKFRKGAMKSLKDPKKKINNRIVSCQLASTGPVGSQQVPDSSGRKIYVSNVHADTDSNKLRAFFEKFGEIETGPIGFDIQSGKSRGFALFVYKTVDGAKKVVEEPYKMFDGHQLHCQFASQGKNKVSAGPVMNAVQPVQAPVLAAVAAAQNMAMLSNYPSLNMNPMFGGLIANPNAGFQPGAAGAFGQGVIGPSQLGQLGGGAGGYGGVVAPHSQLGQLGGAGAGYGGVAPHGLGSLGGSQSSLGSYSTAPMLQGLQHAYPPSSQMGQTSTSRAAQLSLLVASTAALKEAQR
ncbi:hypothetical protein LguiA_013599 [Lonicera macranthoides]